MWHWRRWAIGGSVFCVSAVFLWGSLQYWHQPVLHGFAMQPPRPAMDFTLTAHTGTPVRLHDFRGKLVLLYFGYTSCPSMCPTTLANVAQALRQLGTQAQEVQVLMITVDPDRDTPERLAAYVPSFHPSFIGLTGSPTDIATVAPLFGIYYEKGDDAAATNANFDHSSTLMVVDRQGIMRLIMPFGTPVPDIVTNLATLLRERMS